MLTRAYGQIRDLGHRAVDGLTADQLNSRIASNANTISWLIWHLTRVQDDHIAGAGGLEQVWYSGGWAERFGLPLDPADIGYGHNSDEVAVVQASADLLAAYHDATYEQTVEFVTGLTDADMDTIVDRHWDPPVTMAVRLISVLTDDLEHAGQAAFIRGLTDRR